MTSKFLSAAALAFMGIEKLAAQAPVTTVHQSGADDSNISGLVSQLGQNAILVLLGVVALMGLAWFFCIWNACVGVKKKQKPTSVSTLFLLCLLVGGMNIFGSSCSAVQQAQAADLYAAKAAEGGYCLCHALYNINSNYGYAGSYNQYPYNHPAPFSGEMFCSQCGRRVYHSNR